MNHIVSGEKYIPQCRHADEMDLNEQCALNCTNQKLKAAINDQTFNMTCVDDHLNYKLCTNNTQQFLEVGNDKQENNCEVSNIFFLLLQVHRLLVGTPPCPLARRISSLKDGTGPLPGIVKTSLGALSTS